MTNAENKLVSIDQIEYDKDNPRVNDIQTFIPEDIQPLSSQLELALDDSSQKYRELRTSIQSFGMIFNPIILVETDTNKYVCIEGNTRLSFYKAFSESEDEEVLAKNIFKWKKIPSVIFKNETEEDAKILNKIRLQAHLVGPREWKKINKARFIYRLRNEELMTWTEIGETCGGSKSELNILYKAYEVYQRSYLPQVDDEGGPETSLERKFSNLTEFVNPKIYMTVKEHIGDDFEETFCKWVIDGNKWEKINEIRKFQTIMPNDQAREKFLSPNGDVKSAMEVIVAIPPETPKELKDFCDHLITEIQKIDSEEWEQIKNEEEKTFEAINLLKAQLDRLYEL